jgi:peptide/nickel transport system substrate-binding protein
VSGVKARGRVVARVAVVLLVALAAGCHRWSREAPLVVAFNDLPSTLDPHLQNHSVTWSVLGNIYDGLVRFSPTMQLEPALALSWEQPDDSHWVVSLRPGVRFQDGSPFTAADVVASFERARSHPLSKVRHYLLGVRTMRAVDDLTLVIETDGPAPDLFDRLTFLFIVPRSQAGEAEITSPIGTGPYRFVGRDRDGTVRLEAWAGWRGMPAIHNAELRFYDNDDDAEAAFFSGRADVLHTLLDDQLDAVHRQPGLRAVPQPRLAVELLAVDPAAARGDAARALADVRVRRAILLALDRRGWTNSVFRGNAIVASQYVHPVIFGYDPQLQPEPYDPEAAKRLLAEAGFPHGFEVTLGHGNVDTGLIEAIMANLAEVGIRVTLHRAAFNEIMRLGRAGKLPLMFYAWACSTGDASDFLDTSVHSLDAVRGLGLENYAHYADPGTDALLDEADREHDAARRRELLQRAQRRVLEALRVLPLTIPWSYEGVSSRVEVVTRDDERVWLAGYRWRG